MLIVAAFSWWYGEGWIKQLSLLRRQLLTALDSFSILELLQTLFSPFRQISAGGVSGPIGVKLRAWFDRLISRFVGAFVRIIVIFIGIVWLLLLCIFGILRLALWPFVPLLPVLGIILFSTGPGL